MAVIETWMTALTGLDWTTCPPHALTRPLEKPESRERAGLALPSQRTHARNMPRLVPNSSVGNVSRAVISRPPTLVLESERFPLHRRRTPPPPLWVASQHNGPHSRPETGQLTLVALPRRLRWRMLALGGASTQRDRCSDGSQPG